MRDIGFLTYRILPRPLLTGRTLDAYQGLSGLTRAGCGNLNQFLLLAIELPLGCR